MSPIRCVVEIWLCCALLGHSTSHISVGDVICRCSCTMPVNLQGQAPIMFSSNLRKCKNLVLVTVADTHFPSQFIRSHNTLPTNPELLQTWLLSLSICQSLGLCIMCVSGISCLCVMIIVIQTGLRSYRRTEWSLHMVFESEISVCLCACGADVKKMLRWFVW